MIWSATTPETGLFSGLERHSALADLADRFARLRTLGRGYLEVRLPEGDLPCLTLGFRNDHAVLHRYDESGGLSLHAGDGATAPSTEVEVPIMNEPTEFTGDFILSTGRAWQIVHTFGRTGASGEPGDWYGL
ncbi:hypothetical protein [Streptomyces xanthii]|uniref:Uncharacterized protein n=1 Tax=Streptomyces xanthii TaxID=2768069 RepID=A0A7H1B3W5_9ACTN|nr:hypothetical protein [Streptomyces xanthii]QNS03420.1 hypothetical protein IAG42_07090 [Streptomyces xanthii]